MASLIAGVDGGQSSTTAAVADETGNIIGRGVGPPADLVDERRDSTRQRDAIAAALAAALQDAAAPASTTLRSLVIGLTGHDEGSAPPFALVTLGEAVAVVHDTVIAHAGALAGKAGIVVLAGTGSVALGNVEPGGPFVRAGGWGYFFGDHGGAISIARTAIEWAMQDADRGERSPVGEAALRFFGAPDLRAIQHAFAFGELTRSALAAFATEVLAMSPAELPSMPSQAWHLRDGAAASLVELAAIVNVRLPRAPARRVSYAGGVFRNEGLRHIFLEMVGNRLRADGVAAEVLDPAGEPIDGALLLARRLARDEPIPGAVARA